MEARRAWIVVADRRTAHFYFHAAPGERLEAAKQDSLTFDPVAEDADRPGRVHERVGGGRHAMESPSSKSELELEQAARGIADALRAGNERGAFERVVISAPPDLLGAVRGQLSAPVSDKVCAELTHRWVDLDLEALAGRLTEADVIGSVRA